MSVRNLVKSIQDIMRQDVGVDGDAQRISQLCWMFFLKIIDDQDKQLEEMYRDYKSPLPKRFQWRTWAADPEGITGDELISFANTELFPKLKELSLAGKTRIDRRGVVRERLVGNFSQRRHRRERDEHPELLDLPLEPGADDVGLHAVREEDVGALRPDARDRNALPFVDRRHHPARIRRCHSGDQRHEQTRKHRKTDPTHGHPSRHAA
jgi:hypothetical protein